MPMWPRRVIARPSSPSSLSPSPLSHRPSPSPACSLSLMEKGRSHYDVLGLPSTATLAEIRDAYRRLARKLHPDRSPGTTREFQEINEGEAPPRRRALRALPERGTAGRRGGRVQHMRCSATRRSAQSTTGGCATRYDVRSQVVNGAGAQATGHAVGAGTIQAMAGQARRAGVSTGNAATPPRPGPASRLTWTAAGQQTGHAAAGRLRSPCWRGTRSPTWLRSAR